MDWKRAIQAGIEFRTGPGNEILRIEPRALATFERYRQLRPTDPEAGGMLLASIETNLVRIARATEPETQDKRTRLSFRPALGPQQRTIDKEFSAGLHFIGEWHTHPEPCPVPSQIDVCSMMDCFRLSKHQLAGLVMIIMGTERSMNGLWISIHTENSYHRLATCGPIPPITAESSEG